MRIMLFFDIPSVTSRDRRNYRLFVNGLANEGFLQMQESVYTKLVLNRSSVDLAINRVRKFLPPDGLVQVLVVTEKQFSSIVDLVGKAKTHSEIDTMDRLVIL